MMHFIYCYKAHCDIGQYTSLQGWLIDRWAIYYALDVKNRTWMLAQLISEYLNGSKGENISIPSYKQKMRKSKYYSAQAWSKSAKDCHLALSLTASGNKMIPAAIFKKVHR